MKEKDNAILDVQNLPPVAEMMRNSGLEPKKQFGQNFLFDLNLTGRIAKSVPDIEKMTVFEIGPGPAGLTRAILMAGAPRVIAIEMDPTTKPILDQVIAASDGRLTVVYNDALRFFQSSKFKVQSSKNDLNNKKQTSQTAVFCAPVEKENGLSTFELCTLNFELSDIAICANLPYNVGTELLIRWLHMMADSIVTSGRSVFASLTLMFQKEVGLRITARPGDEHYGRLAVLTSMVGNAKILFDVPNTAFVPRPKVTSAIVQIIPHEKLSVDLETFRRVEKITAALFGQRRKMIRGIIKNVDWSEFNLTGMERAEELSPEKFIEIAKATKI